MGRMNLSSERSVDHKVGHCGILVAPRLSIGIRGMEREFEDNSQNIRDVERSSIEYWSNFQEKCATRIDD